MKFYFDMLTITGNTCTATVWFKSSKEKLQLGTLTFTDSDGAREDVYDLLCAALENNPLFQCIKRSR